jgi:hypothetical protein
MWKRRSSACFSSRGFVLAWNNSRWLKSAIPGKNYQALSKFTTE